MFQYIFPLSKWTPSDIIHIPLGSAPYDIKFTTVGDTPYECNVPITLTKSEYIDGASESDNLNVFLIFETEKTTDQLSAIKTIISNAVASFDPSDAKYGYSYKHLIT